MNGTSIGIVTTVGTYESFLPAWCESVRNLERQPDRIVIAAQSAENVRAITAVHLPEAEIVSVPQEFHFGTFLNQAIAECETDWIVWIGVDDRYYPHALNHLDATRQDVSIFGMRLDNGRQWLGGSLDDAREYNPAPCGSPFRRWIWESIPFQTHLAPFEDWAFWVGARALGATWHRTLREDFNYHTHAEQIVPPHEPTAGRIREWAATL